MATAVERAYIAIREGIARGAYKAGDHLTANDLAAAIGMSRTPVREAMRRLHAEGLIQFIPNRGAFVSRLDEAEVEKIYRLRVLLEGHAAEAAAMNATAEQTEELSALAEHIHALVWGDSAPDLEKVSELNNQFHKLIVQAADSSRLETALAAIIEMPLVLRTFQRYDLEELRRSAQQHLDLVTAIRVRDPQWALSVMTGHILSAQHALLRSTISAA